MRYTVSNIINKPLEEVIARFSDPDGMKHWMEGLQEVIHLEGTPGKKGAKSELRFIHKKREFTMTETILEENLPAQIKFSYLSPQGYNEVEMRFEELSDSNTSQSNTSYFEFKGANINNMKTDFIIRQVSIIIYYCDILNSSCCIN